MSDADYIIANHEDSAKEAPLHVASRCGNLDILELLLKHGANIYAVDAKGRTCLHCAVQSGHSTCLRFLLQIGGDQIIEERDQRGLNCLHIAVKQNCINCVEILLRSGANMTATTPNGDDILRLAKGQRARKLIEIIFKYQKMHHSKTRANDQNLDLFKGLEVNEQFKGAPLALNQTNNVSIGSGFESLSPMACQSNHTYSSEHLEGGSQAESFFYSGYLWFMYFHHNRGRLYPYFLRAHDNHSQVCFSFSFLHVGL